MLIDVHCHMNLYLNPHEVLQEASQAGVEKIIAVAMSVISQKRIIEISKQFDSVYPSLGIHPEEIKMNDKIEAELDFVVDLINSNQIDLCAIGEVGLDHHFIKDKNMYPLQLKIFNRMLSLAQKLQLPINIHSKGAEQQIFDILSSYNIPNVNIHWYSGPEKLLRLGIERGYYFSITPAVNYSSAVKKTASLVDIDHILLESDGPVKYSGKTGAPMMIKETLNTVAKLRKLTPEELEHQIEINTKNIFPKIF